MSWLPFGSQVIQVSVIVSLVSCVALACGDMALSTMRASKRARQKMGGQGMMSPMMMPGAMQGMMPVMHGMFGMPGNQGMNPAMMAMNPSMAMMGMQASHMGHQQQGHQQQPSLPQQQQLPLQLPEEDNGHDFDGESEAEAIEELGSNNSRQSVVSMPAGMPGGGGGGGQPSNDPANDELSARRTVEMFISRSVTYVKNMPRQRLGEVLELVDRRLDSTFTSECSPAGLLCLLWVYTRIRPMVKLTDLRH